MAFILRYRGVDPGDQFFGLLRAGFRKEHDKFVSAEPCDDVVGSALRFHGVCDIFKKPVSGQMAEGVVCELQAVDVRHHQCDRKVSFRVEPAGVPRRKICGCKAP